MSNMLPQSTAEHHSQPRLDIIVVGAGIGGCAAAFALARKGHKVLVLESQSDLKEFGAGIQIMANAVRIFSEWGLREEFEKIVNLSSWILMKTADGKETGRIPQNVENYYEDLLGFPLWQIHRPDYQRILARAAQQAGAEMMFSAKVDNVDPDTGTVKLANGQSLTADLIVGADGIRSPVRTAMPQNKAVHPIPFSEGCFRTLLTRDEIKSVPEVAKLLDEQNTALWSGTGKFILTYPISAGKILNVVGCYRNEDSAPVTSFNAPAEPEDFRAQYSDYSDPVIWKLFSLVRTCANWKIADIPLLDTYVTGKTVLVGDAAHAMVPHVASGANMAIEDAAVLAECLDYPNSLLAYDALRKPRTQRVWQLARTQRDSLEEPEDEEEERTRAKTLQEATKRAYQEFEMSREERQKLYSGIRGDNMWADYPGKEYSKWLYGYNAVGEAQKYLQKQMG